MTNIQASTSELADKAYSIAWREFRKIGTSTPDEIMFAPRRLRWYVQIMTAVGARDPKKIATAALGMLRQYEQISRSKARVRGHVPLAPAA
jgi:DNA-binding FadR family transcriptional regulator